MQNQLPQSDIPLNINLNHQIPSFIPERQKFKSKTEIFQTPKTSNHLFHEYHDDKDLQSLNRNKQYSTAKNSPMNVNRLGFKNPFFSPIWSYYDSSQQYLKKCLRANIEGMNPSNIDYENSNNFKRKESFCSKPSTDDHVTNDNMVLDNMEDIEPLDSQLVKGSLNDNQINLTEDYLPECFSDPIGSIARCCCCFTPDQNPKAFRYQKEYGKFQTSNKKKNFGTPPFGTIQSLNYFNTSHHNRENQYQYTTEMFGRMGWICMLCNNFNYDTRNKCNRCKNTKSPKILRSLFPSIPPEQMMHSHNFHHNNNPSSLPIPIKHNIITNSCNCTRPNDIGPSTVSPGIVNSMNVISIVHNQNINLYNNYHQQTENENDYDINKESNNNNNIANGNSINQAFNNKRKVKPFSERIGDWVCNNCKNLNFSFRNICNRCQMIKTEGGIINSLK